MASHVTRSVLDYKAAAQFSVCILIIDLVKAFDRAVREIAVGFPADAGPPEEYLPGLGLALEQAKWVAEHVAAHGALWEHFAVHPWVLD